MSPTQEADKIISKMYKNAIQVRKRTDKLKNNFEVGDIIKTVSHKMLQSDGFRFAIDTKVESPLEIQEITAEGTTASMWNMLTGDIMERCLNKVEKIGSINLLAFCHRAMNTFFKITEEQTDRRKKRGRKKKHQEATK